MDEPEGRPHLLYANDPNSHFFNVVDENEDNVYVRASRRP